MCVRLALRILEGKSRRWLRCTERPYRNGDYRIQSVLDGAYRDARQRPDRLRYFKDIASEHVNGERIYMGDIHGPARAFARSHIVAPGNGKYLQSLDEYKEKKGRKP